MSKLLKEKLSSQIPGLREEAKSIVKNHGKKVIDQVTIDQLFGGMRGIKGLICDTSSVGLDTGLIIRGIPILELTEKLPEEVFYLLLTGELPDEKTLKDLQTDLQKRGEVPAYVWNVLNAMPEDSHPMVMFSTAILCMEKESEYRKQYDKGTNKDKLWEAMYDDCLNLIAQSPQIAAFIYRKKFIYACKNADRIIAISRQTKQDIIDFYKIDAGKIDICYQSCNPAFATEIDSSERERISQLYQ
ncbi:MAG: hypothetical protein LH629_04080, partial [Ignavibacteria bacterium]|nr:hypothetical protein [Ignavibacteria bacterium]